MPRCGSQAILCDIPIRFDTYRGCAHGCRYCFTQHKINLSNMKPFESEGTLKSFIGGFRERETRWCDWNIPLHWGGVSDRFQPMEAQIQNSFRALKVFAESKYPFVVSTKGKLIADWKYLGLPERMQLRYTDFFSVGEV